ncbi:putative RING-type zinc-finger-containing protein, partial [Homarus americanus]
MGGEVSVLPEVIHDDADSREIHTCRVCANTYNHGDNAPVSLPCGHTFCKSCVMRIMTQNGVCCLLATCRKQHKVTSIDSFPVIYALIPQSTSSSNTASENNSTSRTGTRAMTKHKCNITFGQTIITPVVKTMETKSAAQQDDLHLSLLLSSSTAGVTYICPSSLSLQYSRSDLASVLPALQYSRGDSTSVLVLSLQHSRAQQEGLEASVLLLVLQHSRSDLSICPPPCPPVQQGDLSICPSLLVSSTGTAGMTLHLSSSFGPPQHSSRYKARVTLHLSPPVLQYSRSDSTSVLLLVLQHSRSDLHLSSSCPPPAQDTAGVDSKHLSSSLSSSTAEVTYILSSSCPPVQQETLSICPPSCPSTAQQECDFASVLLLSSSTAGGLTSVLLLSSSTAGVTLSICPPPVLQHSRRTHICPLLLSSSTAARLLHLSSLPCPPVQQDTAGVTYICPPPCPPAAGVTYASVLPLSSSTAGVSLPSVLLLVLQYSRRDPKHLSSSSSPPVQQEDSTSWSSSLSLQHSRGLYICPPPVLPAQEGPCTVLPPLSSSTAGVTLKHLSSLLVPPG